MVSGHPLSTFPKHVVGAGVAVLVIGFCSSWARDVGAWACLLVVWGASSSSIVVSKLDEIKPWYDNARHVFGFNREMDTVAT